MYLFYFVFCAVWSSNIPQHLGAPVFIYSVFFFLNVFRISNTPHTHCVGFLFLFPQNQIWGWKKPRSWGFHFQVNAIRQNSSKLFISIFKCVNTIQGTGQTFVTDFFKTPPITSRKMTTWVYLNLNKNDPNLFLQTEMIQLGGFLFKRRRVQDRQKT